MPEISIIVPVYNVEPYLHRCVDSILNQTFHDFELILVDDGSPDNCGAICDEYANIDNRIKVIHKANSGLSSARNSGLDIASGDYIGFVDSDDFIHPQMYEILINVIKSTKAGYVACGVCKTNSSLSFDTLTVNQYFNNAHKVYSSQDVLNHYNKFFYPTLHAYSCNKLYKRQCFIHNRFNSEMRLYEDECICLELIEAAKSIAIVPIELYFYYQSENSLMRGQMDRRFILTLNSLQHMSDYMKNKGILSEVDILEFKWFIAYISLYYSIQSQNILLKHELKKYQIFFFKKYSMWMKNPEMTLMYKVLLNLFLIFPPFAKPIFKYLQQ